MKPTIQELTEIANNFLQQEYNEILDIPIVINGRLKRTLGAFVRKYENKKKNEITSIYIELSKKILTYGHQNAIIDVLKHELVHYVLWKQGKPNTDGHPVFEGELKRLGIGSTETNTIGIKYIGKCTKCRAERISNTKSYYTSGKYVSSCCKAKLELIGEEIHDGVNEPITKFYIVN